MRLYSRVGTYRILLGRHRNRHDSCSIVILCIVYTSTRNLVFSSVASPYIIPQGLRDNNNNIIILLCSPDNQNIGTGVCLIPTSCMQFEFTYFAICVMFVRYVMHIIQALF